jgi:hypothetical protein
MSAEADDRHQQRRDSDEGHQCPLGRAHRVPADRLMTKRFLRAPCLRSQSRRA